MAEVDFSVHENFARNAAAMENWAKDLKVPMSQVAGIVPDRILDNAPKYPANDLLFGSFQGTSWGRVRPPENFLAQRGNPRIVAPSFGSSERIDASVIQIKEIEAQHNISTGVRPGEELIELEDLENQGAASSSFQSTSSGQKIVNAIRAVRDNQEQIDQIHAREKQFLQG